MILEFGEISSVYIGGNFRVGRAVVNATVFFVFFAAIVGIFL